jgi:DNA-directed RNA polymerase subunit omega
MEQRKEYYRDPLTNEKIIQKFESQFDLVNYAIRLAENMIHSGRDARVKIDCQNRALQILGEIALGRDVFDEIIEMNHYAQDVQQESRFSTRESREEPSLLKGEKKRKKTFSKD